MSKNLKHNFKLAVMYSAGLRRTDESLLKEILQI